MTTRRGKSPPLGEVAWAEARDLYVTGDETYASLATRLGVSRQAVERHACDRTENGGKTWNEWRAEFLDAVSERARTKISELKAETIVKVHERHTTTLQKLFDAATEKAIEDLKSGNLEGKDQVRSLLAIIAQERKTTGLDKLEMRITGDPANPIVATVTIESKLENLSTEELRKLAKR